jgi:drug/metabolite transporter (DMT)-like permease
MKARPHGSFDMRGRRIAELQVLSAAACFSTAGLFMGLLETNIWTVVFWRSFVAFCAVAIYAVFWPHRHFCVPDRAGLLSAVCSAAAMVAYITALRLTTVANVAVIHGTLPLVTACLASLTTRERMSSSSVALALLAAMGAGLIFLGSGASTLRMAGDSLGFLMTILMALMTIAYRRSETSTLILVALSNGIAALVGALFSPNIAVSAYEFLMLTCFALVQMALGLLLYTMGARVLPPAESALISLAELPLSSYWGWAVSKQVPAALTMAGGAVVFLTVAIHLTKPTTQRHKDRGVR